ncbi:MAG: hypothetical protein ACOYNP_01675 [Gemmataceae bacterium]
MVEAIRKLALGFQLVYMGFFVIVISVVLCYIVMFAVAYQFEHDNITFEAMAQLRDVLPVAMGACMLLGNLLGLTGRYFCTLTPEVAQKACAYIRTSFALEMLALILNMYSSLQPLIQVRLIDIGVLPPWPNLLFNLRWAVSLIGFIIGISSILYFVMYMRDLAGFVGSDDLSMRSEKLRRSIVSMLRLSFVTAPIAVAMLIVGLMANPDLSIVLGAMGCALGLLYIAILVLSISVFFRYVRIVVAMPAVLKAYIAPTDTQNGPSE